MFTMFKLFICVHFGQKMTIYGTLAALVTPFNLPDVFHSLDYKG